MTPRIEWRKHGPVDEAHGAGSTRVSRESVLREAR